MRQIAENVLATDKLFICTADMEKSFDSIQKRKIWRSMNERGVTDKIVNVVNNLYRRTGNIVRIGGNVNEIVVVSHYLGPFIIRNDNI